MITAKKKCIIILLLLISCIYWDAKSQTQEDINTVRKVLQTHNHKLKVKDKYQYANENNTNELSWIFSKLFLGYKAFFSSQDMSSCTFTPSCSEYGMLAVKKQGVIVGIINTFDRLTRCNGLSPELYEIDPKTHLYIDPL